ncbi:MAG TPA: type III pantothenate kinase [Flavobacterium sp.]|jgi:type III pantothenate kinase
MVLAIDIGNTRAKAAVYDGNTLFRHAIMPAFGLAEWLQAIVEEYPEITDIVTSSVADTLPDAPVPVHVVDYKWKFPFINKYATPQTLGADRMVLAAGAVLNYPGMNRLVIDAGTCITYDFIDAAGNYLGGAISPGIALRYKSLHDYTARLPLLKATVPQSHIGNSTSESIHSGVVNGVAFEIDSFINRYRENLPNFIIILTGGDTEFLAERLKNRIFAHSNFLLESLNQTFQYQNQT